MYKRRLKVKGQRSKDEGLRLPDRNILCITLLPLTLNLEPNTKKERLDMKKILICLFSLLIAVPAYAIDGTQLSKQIDRNLNPESYDMYRKLINVEPNGRKMEYTFFSVKKGLDKLAGVFLAPASEKGRSTLRLGDNMWLYIPNGGKPIRITSLQSVIGGVFNNADILALDYSVEYNAERVEDLGDEYLLYCQAKKK